MKQAKVAILAPGAMGAAVAAKLNAHGLTVLTLLAGRSAASAERARAAGMQPVDEAALFDADLLLSIVPPAQALALAQRLAPALAVAPRRPVYVDCNAVNPDTVDRIARVITETGTRFVDASIIGLPPREGYDGPTFFASGRDAEALRLLEQGGVRVEVLDAPIGAASALKMCYGGITKGLVALGSAMILAAVRAGCDRALLGEMEHSQKQLLSGFNRSIPDMFPKAARWVAEMQEVSAFLGADRAEADMYAAIARFYERIAADQLEGGQEVARLAGFLRT